MEGTPPLHPHTHTPLFLSHSTHRLSCPSFAFCFFSLFYFIKPHVSAVCCRRRTRDPSLRAHLLFRLAKVMECKLGRVPVDTVTAACGRVTDQPDLQAGGGGGCSDANTLPPLCVFVQAAEPGERVCVCIQKRRCFISF